MSLRVPLFLCNGKIQGSIVAIYWIVFVFPANRVFQLFNLLVRHREWIRLWIFPAKIHPIFLPDFYLWSCRYFFYLLKRNFFIGTQACWYKVFSFQRKIPIDYYMNIEEMNGLFESTRLSNMNNPSNKEKTIHTILRERGEGNRVEFIKTDIRGTILLLKTMNFLPNMQ